MAVRKRLLVVMGTRPEAIKLAPLILKAREQPERFEVLVVRTSQHQEMLDQIVESFGLPIDLDLDIMRPNQSLAYITTRALDGLHDAMERMAPDCVVVQGDTTTTFAGALAAFYRRIPVAHVEAGLRTFDKTQPYPEEVNRCLTSQLADYHFAPTELARRHLLQEHVPAQRIWVTGNTAIDALQIMLNRFHGSHRRPPAPGRTILLTAHRRENQGEPLRHICQAVRVLLERFPDLRVIYPVHLSPSVRSIVHQELRDHPRITLCEPLGYEPFVLAMNEATLILTDSGGIQEEAPALGKPVLILRETTERPEAVEAGTARLVGTSVAAITGEVERLLTDPGAYQAMAQARNPFGDGHASEQILDVIAAGGSGAPA